MSSILRMPNELVLCLGECLGPTRDMLALLSTCRRYAQVLSPMMHRMAFNAEKDGATTLLFWAAGRGSVAVVRNLVENYGVDVKSRKLIEEPYDEGTSITALHLAARYGRVGMINLLLELGADINAEWLDAAGNSKGTTPLHEATDEGRSIAVRTLMKNNANTSAYDHYGRTPLHIAARKGHPAVAAELLKHGAKHDTRTTTPQYSGMTALHLAVDIGPVDPNGFLASNKRKVIKMLVDHGANLHDRNRIDFPGWTPLHVAVEKGNSREIVSQLLDLGADIDAVTDFSETPLHLLGARVAAELLELQYDEIPERRLDVFEVMLRSGADPSMLWAPNPPQALQFYPPAQRSIAHSVLKEAVRGIAGATWSNVPWLC